MSDREPPSDKPSDADLRALGLEQTRAWVRKHESGKARRNRRHREKAASCGRRQLSVTVPEEARDIVRRICSELCSERLTTAEVQCLLPPKVPGQALNAEPGHKRPPRPQRVLSHARITARDLAAFVAGLAVGGTLT